MLGKFVREILFPATSRVRFLNVILGLLISSYDLGIDTAKVFWMGLVDLVKFWSGRAEQPGAAAWGAIDIDTSWEDLTAFDGDASMNPYEDGDLSYPEREPMFRTLFLPTLCSALERHLGDMWKLLMGYPKNADLKWPVARLRILQKLFLQEKPPYDPVLPYRLLNEARTMYLFLFPRPRFYPFKIEEMRMVIKGKAWRPDEELVNEAKDLVDAIARDVEESPPNSTASDLVLKNMVKLSFLGLGGTET